jgi:CRP/FNR family transcriptional regulator, nitrogen oxide reductase regulator
MALFAPGHRTRAHTFDGLARDIVEHARKHATFVTVRRGEMLTRQGDPARQFLIVQEGYAKLVSTSPEGIERLIGIAGPHDALGHAAVAGGPRDYLVSSCALSTVTAACWDRDRAIAIADEFPEVRRRIDAQLVRNFELVLGRLHLVSEGTVTARLARALLELAQRHGVAVPGGVGIAPPLTRQDIAAMVGTTLFTASRVLAQWQDDGLIESARAKIRIRSLEGLRLLATDHA